MLCKKQRELNGDLLEHACSPLIVPPAHGTGSEGSAEMKGSEEWELTSD